MKTIVNILSLKKVPDLFWTAPTPFTIRPPAISILFLLLGLIVSGFGHAILFAAHLGVCLLYTSPSPRDRTRSRMPSSA